LEWERIRGHFPEENIARIADGGVAPARESPQLGSAGQCIEIAPDQQAAHAREEDLRRAGKMPITNLIGLHVYQHVLSD